MDKRTSYIIYTCAFHTSPACGKAAVYPGLFPEGSLGALAPPLPDSPPLPAVCSILRTKGKRGSRRSRCSLGKWVPLSKPLAVRPPTSWQLNQSCFRHREGLGAREPWALLLPKHVSRCVPLPSFHSLPLHTPSSPSPRLIFQGVNSILL